MADYSFGREAQFDSHMPIRDDSAGPYGTWNNDDLIWLDYLTAKASDGGNALANLGRNLAQGFSPIGTSEQGNMALQVPPIVSGIAQSYSNLAGSPSHPGNAYDLTGVPELDAPIQQDMSNVLLSLYGGNAVSGITKPRGALGAGAMREEAAAPIRAYHGTKNEFEKFDGPSYFSTNRQYAEKFAGQDGRLIEADLSPTNPYWTNNQSFVESLRSFPERVDELRGQGHDAAIFSGAPGNLDPVLQLGGYAHPQIYMIEPGTVKSATTGETLFSDTGKPSILGSAMAGAGENRSFGSSADLAGSTSGAVTQTPGITAYHGSPHDFDKFSLDKIGTGEGAQAYGHGLYFADNEGVAKSYRDKLKFARQADTTDAISRVTDDLNYYNGNDQAARASYSSMLKSPNPDAVKMAQENLAVIDDVISANPGKMYQVRINANPDDFLDWDKPLSEQATIADRLKSAGIDPDQYKSATGGDFHNWSRPEDADSGQWANTLREAGIPGIRYLDGNSRGAGEGSYNYVVFDDSLIDILRKYGLAGAAVGAGALAQPDEATAGENYDLPPWLQF